MDIPSRRHSKIFQGSVRLVWTEFLLSKVCEAKFEVQGDKVEKKVTLA